MKQKKILLQEVQLVGELDGGFRMEELCGQVGKFVCILAWGWHTDRPGPIPI